MSDSNHRSEGEGNGKGQDQAERSAETRTSQCETVSPLDEALHADTAHQNDVHVSLETAVEHERADDLADDVHPFGACLCEFGGEGAIEIAVGHNSGAKRRKKTQRSVWKAIRPRIPSR